jgi:hypothetical protein
MNASAPRPPVSPRLLPPACGAGHPGLRRVEHLPSRGCDVDTNGNPSTRQPEAVPAGKFALGNQTADQRVRHRKRMATPTSAKIARLYRQACRTIARAETGCLVPIAYGRFCRQFEA